MLKYVSKITMDILPSVAATIIGAYIVNHYITAKPAPDAPAARVVGQPEKGRPQERCEDFGAPFGDGQYPGGRCQGEGYL